MHRQSSFRCAVRHSEAVPIAVSSVLGPHSTPAFGLTLGGTLQRPRDFSRLYFCACVRAAERRPLEEAS